MKSEHHAFLQHIRKYVTENPDVAVHVGQYATAGLEDALGKTYERAADMEVALVCALSKRHKSMDGIILQKLKKWEGKTSVNWDSEINRMTKDKASDAAGDAT